MVQFAAAQSAAGAGPSFINARFASQASSTIYAGYTVGRVFGFIGLVQNPRSEYREALAGVGVSVALPSGNGLAVGSAAAYASDGWYTQLYLLPALHAGRVRLEGTIEFYLPLERSGSVQASASPLYTYVVASPRWSFGATYLLGLQRGLPATQAAGPSARLTIPRGSLTLDLIRRIDGAPNEVRVTLAGRY
jgi:hypothetical protein